MKELVQRAYARLREWWEPEPIGQYHAMQRLLAMTEPAPSAEEPELVSTEVK